MGGFSRRRLGLIVTASAGLAGSAFAALGADAGRSAFPGKNGRIIFNDQGGRLMIVNADGSGVVRIAQTGASDQRESQQLRRRARHADVGGARDQAQAEEAQEVEA
jgi:hypothetical protein